eukprot:scaffold36975_cov63-Phaeocystis_antarctica.AAC.4
MRLQAGRHLRALREHVELELVEGPARGGGGGGLVAAGAGGEVAVLAAELGGHERRQRWLGRELELLLEEGEEQLVELLRVLLHARVDGERLREGRRVVARARRVLQLREEHLQLRQDVLGTAALRTAAAAVAITVAAGHVLRPGRAAVGSGVRVGPLEDASAEGAVHEEGLQQRVHVARRAQVAQPRAPLVERLQLLRLGVGTERLHRRRLARLGLLLGGRDGLAAVAGLAQLRLLLGRGGRRLELVGL